MAAMIWDSVAQAFVETANTPMRYDAESEAWVETTGMVWDAGAQAWTEKWSPNRVLYLYKDGDECTNVTGGWGIDGYSYPNYNVLSGTKNADNMHIKGDTWPHLEILGTLRAIDLTHYSRIHLDIVTETNNTDGVRVEISVAKSPPYLLTKPLLNINDRDYVIDISELAGECYIWFDVANDASRKGTIYKVWLD